MGYGLVAKILERRIIMEEFLTDYIQMMAEAQDIELDESTLQEIVNSIAANEVVWDVLDEHINYEFDEREVR